MIGPGKLALFRRIAEPRVERADDRLPRCRFSINLRQKLPAREKDFHMVEKGQKGRAA